MPVTTASPAALERKRELEVELERIVKILIEQYRPEKIILFGSLATGEVGEWSDIDLCIIKETDKRPLDRELEVTRLVDQNLAADFFVYTPGEFAASQDHYFIRDEILGRGKVLYDAGH